MFKNPIYKIISIISIISGAILGVFSIIPLLTFSIIILLMFIMAPFIIIYFKNLNLIKEIEIEKGIIYGAIAGFTGCIGYSLLFFPLAFILDLIFKIQSFIWVKVICQNFIFLIGTIFFTAILSAILNAFTGFLTAYLFQYFKKGN